MIAIARRRNQWRAPDKATMGNPRDSSVLKLPNVSSAGARCYAAVPSNFAVDTR